MRLTTGAAPGAILDRVNGLYSWKPWYAARLTPIRQVLLRWRVSPDAVTAAGVGFGALAGVALGTVPPGPVAAVLVAGLLAARLACANLDGALARESGRSSRRGTLINDLGDRAAELAAFGGLLVLARPTVVAAAALAASAPSWVSLAGAAAGAPRRQDGPMGKTERCVMLVAIAATGWAEPLLLALVAGAVLTVLVRLRRLVAASC